MENNTAYYPYYTYCACKLPCYLKRENIAHLSAEGPQSKDSVCLKLHLTCHPATCDRESVHTFSKWTYWSMLGKKPAIIAHGDNTANFFWNDFSLKGIHV